MRGQGEAPFARRPAVRAGMGQGSFSPPSMSGTRQCPHGSSSTGIPGQRVSRTASLQGEGRDGRAVRNAWGGTSHGCKLSPFGEGNSRNTGLG